MHGALFTLRDIKPQQTQREQEKQIERNEVVAACGLQYDFHITSWCD